MLKWNRVLFVEDDPKDRELILEALKNINLMNEIIAVPDGQEAVDYLFYKEKYSQREKGNPAFILLDIKLPKLSGIEVLRIIKSDASLNKISVVMLTSCMEDNDLKTCYELGANAYVIKPIEFKEFVDAIKNAGLFWGILNELPNIL